MCGKMLFLSLVIREDLAVNCLCIPHAALKILGYMHRLGLGKEREHVSEVSVGEMVVSGERVGNDILCPWDPLAVAAGPGVQ